MPEWLVKVRTALLRNKGAKAAAVFLACMTWYAIQSAISFETRLSDIPLTLQLDEGWAVLERSASTVDVLFRGSQEDIRYLNRDQVHVELDLRGQEGGGEVQVKLRPRNIRAPAAVRPMLIRPEEITLVLDRQGEKQVPVKIETQGAPSEDYEVERLVPTPATVTLAGPRRRLQSVDSVSAGPIDLEGRTRSFRKARTPLLPPSDSWVASLNPSNVMVEVFMAERTVTKEWPEVPVGVLVAPGPRTRLEVWPPKVKVSVRGRAEALKTVQPEDIRLYADCSELDKGAVYELPVRAHLPPGATLIKIEPSLVKVTVGSL